MFFDQLYCSNDLHYGTAPPLGVATLHLNTQTELFPFSSRLQKNQILCWPQPAGRRRQIFL